LEYVTRDTKPSTAAFYERCLRRVLRFEPLADMAIDAGHAGEMIAKYSQFRKGNEIANSIVTINGEIRTIRRLFNVARELHLITALPVIHALPGEVGRDRVISYLEEAIYLAKATETLDDAATIAVDTGMRPNSELFSLEWKNVHLDAEFIHVEAGKTKNAARNIPMTSRVRDVLLRREKTALSRFVFPSEESKCGHLVTVQHAHERTIKRAKLQAFPFYSWRHTFATRCAESGMDKFSLARLMGHSSPAVAERYYIRVTETHVTEGFDKFVAYQTAKQLEAIPAATNEIQ
jgi:integrase